MRAHLANEVNDANDKGVVVAVHSHQEAVVHHAHAGQERSVSPKHPLQLFICLLLHLKQAVQASDSLDHGQLW